MESVSGGSLLKTDVGMPAFEMAGVNYVQMYASPGLSRCVWSGQLRNSLRNDVHAGVQVSPQTDHAVAAEYWPALQEWINSAPVSQEKLTVLLQITETAFLVSLRMTASQEKLMTGLV